MCNPSITANAHIGISPVLLASIQPFSLLPIFAVGGIQLYNTCSSPFWEDENVDFASEAIRSDSHRDNIKQRLDELLGSVKSMEDRSEQLLERGVNVTTLVDEEMLMLIYYLSSSGNELSNSDTETIAEKIDEEIHHLQYLLDHARRCDADVDEL